MHQIPGNYGYFIGEGRVVRVREKNVLDIDFAGQRRSIKRMRCSGRSVAEERFAFIPALQTTRSVATVLIAVYRRPQSTRPILPIGA